MGAPFPKTVERVILKELVDLQLFRVLPLGVPFSFVNEYCFVMVSWNLEAVLVAWSVAEVL